MKPIMINLQDNFYTLPPEAYTFSRDSSRQKKKCTVAVSMTDDSSGVYILGDTFLRNFVTTFDFANGQMHLAINKNAPAGVKIEYKMAGKQLFGIIAASLSALALLILCICCCVSQHRKRQQPQKSNQFSKLASN